ncbi:polyprotein [Lednice virus]|uniref:Envelopment polyprotein n=1 Tax=Lednice virus TaxID=2656737 RepID=A0A5P8N835_9VIRU|nr:polyprotein [Lednice virus]QFR36982.1 polyprotein [Lednice virus]
MKTYLIFALICITLPKNDGAAVRCFAGGSKIMERTSNISLSELCLKDDVSQLKIIVDHMKNGSGLFSTATAWRKWTISDWTTCNPKKVALGTISVINIDKNFVLNSASYICNKECTITVDKERAQVLLQSDGLNHFEISGTTLSSGWFKLTATVALDQTCEHVKVSCGQKSMQFHACFKNHMSCIRFLHRSIMPASFAVSICQNIELILMTTFTLIIFLMLTILTKTYICYLLLPIFIPFAYLYGFIYDKTCKKCALCGLAFHPFTKCGTHCVCGCRFENSESMKTHREKGKCPGFKSMRTARVLCKAKGSAFTLSILLATLALGFLTPVQGIALDETKPIYSEDQLPESFQEMQTTISIFKFATILNAGWTYTMLVITVVLYFLYKKYLHRLMNFYVIHCKECDMLHDKRGLKYNGDFTNKCGFCTCGQVEDAMGLTVHQVKNTCSANYKAKMILNWLIVLILATIIKDSMMLAAAANTEFETCIKHTEITPECTGPFMEVGICDHQQKSLKYQDIISLLSGKGTISKLDIDLIEALPDKITKDLDIIQNSADFHHQLMLEYAFLLRHCDYYTSYRFSNSHSQILWQTAVKLNETNVCKNQSSKKICKCLKSDQNCGKSEDLASSAKTYYQNKESELSQDMSTILYIIKKMIPGSGYSYVLNLTKSDNIDKLKQYLTNISGKFPDNKKLKSFVDLANIIISNASKINIVTEEQPPEYKNMDFSILKGGTTDMLEANFDQTITSNRVTCSSPLRMICISPRTKASSGEMYVCRYSGKYYIIDTGKYHLYKHQSGSLFCAADKQCRYEFRILTTEQMKAVFKDRCKSAPFDGTPGYQNEESITCKIVASGQCSYNNQPGVSISLCTDGRYYPEARGRIYNADPEQLCFDNTCTRKQPPYNQDLISNCTWENPILKPLRPKTDVSMTFQEYKDQLLKKINTDLVLHKFVKTQNLPYFIPQFKYITLQGTSTTDGITSSFIYFEIPALTGSSAGYKVINPDGEELMDLIIYVKTSKTIAKYRHQYSTGPTIAVNTKHQEHCTGKCPETIEHDDGWATFSKERTSNWGCEEFGCLAIETGCLYGSCQDVIKRELDVYSKTEEDRISTELCITLSHDTYCVTIDSTTPTINDYFEVQYKTVDVQTLPKMIAINHHKLFRGQINEVGSFGKFCGNVQLIGNRTYGQAAVKFDYICHAAQRKDVIIRKCFENNYQSCKLLTHDTDLILEESTETAEVINNKRITGQIALKVFLGDFNYKQYTVAIEADIEANCVGCTNCIKGITCEVKIKTEIEATCQVVTPCPSYTNRIIIKPNVEIHTILMKCDKRINSGELTIRICSMEVQAHLSTIESNDKLELSTGDQSTYIHEEDLRCNTWICKVRDEGISFIFKPLTDWLGSFTKPILIAIVCIISVIILVYIFMPMCARLRDILKKNEYEYLQDSKAAKPRAIYTVKGNKVKIGSSKAFD